MLAALFYKRRKIWIEYVYGLLRGAVDFNDWKNGILCSGRDAKVLEAKSGMEDDGVYNSCIYRSICMKHGIWLSGLKL